MASCRAEVYDVIVIGGGWSGLMSCKYAKEEGLHVRVIEKRDDLGGVWKYSSDPNIVTVMNNSRTSSSSATTEISDFPMPDNIGEFPKHKEIFKYLNDYADKYELRKHIHFSCGVISTNKESNEWIIKTDIGITYYCKNIIICAGVHQNPNRDLEHNLFKDFQGEIWHAGNIKSFKEQHRGKRIMIIGGGETSSDVLDEWYEASSTIIWCIPNGQHFFRKYAKLLPHREPQALDKASSRLLKVISPHVKSKPGLAWVCKWTTNGSLLAYQGHGIPEFKNNANFFHSFINKHAHALDYIDYKKVIPKGKICKVIGKTVYFNDGSNHDVDVVILCTGYKTSIPFLPDQYKCDLTDLYKYVVHPDDPTVSFVGYARPIVGSIPMLSEMQTRWINRVISGKVKMANRDEMLETIKTDKLFWNNYFENTSRRINTLVEAYTYLDDIAKISNCYPDYWSLFKRNPRGCLTAILAPGNGATYLLNDQSKEEYALENLQRHSEGTITALNLITILLFRLFMFDWFCDLLGEAKYKIQTSKIWCKIRNFQVIKLLDYLWCTPKRLLFDNNTR